MMMKIQITEEFNWEFWNYAFDLEEKWQNFSSRFTDEELLEIFPEAKRVIPEKIKEWEQRRVELLDIIEKKLTLIKNKITDEFSYWFWREWVKVNEGQKFLKVNLHVARLKRLFWATKGRVSKGQLTEEEIKRVLDVSIEILINQSLKKCGKVLVGLCPFHNEKHPSFFIYPATNSFYCYGCQKGGNVINFAEELYNFSFKEAVEFLLNNF